MTTRAGSTARAEGRRLLERERELEAFGAALGAAVAGMSALVLVEGPAGIGKSRLLNAARGLAVDSGVDVLAARGSELERDFPFGIVRHLFESLVVDESVGSRLLSGAATAAAPVFDRQSARSGEPPAEGSFMVLHGLYWLTVNLCSERPLLLAIDDVHWCDRASLRFLAFLARRLEDLPVALVASLRRSEPGADEAMLAELTGDPQAQVIMPRLLTAAAVAELVAIGWGRASSRRLPRRVMRRRRATRCCSRNSSRRSPSIRSRPTRPHRRHHRARAESCVQSGAAPARQAVRRRRPSRPLDCDPRRRRRVPGRVRAGRTRAVGRRRRDA